MAKIYTIEAFAHAHGVLPADVERWIDEGQVTAIQTPLGLRIDQDEWDSWFGG